MHPSICFSPLLICMYRRASNKVCRHNNWYSLLVLKVLTVLKIFGIYEDAQLTRGTFWDSMSRELGKKGQEYKNRCVVRSVWSQHLFIWAYRCSLRQQSPGIEGCIFVPASFPAYEGQFSPGSVPDLPSDDAEQVRVSIPTTSGDVFHRIPRFNHFFCELRMNLEWSTAETPKENRSFFAGELWPFLHDVFWLWVCVRNCWITYSPTGTWPLSFKFRMSNFPLQIDPPLTLRSPKELEIIEHPHSSYVLGRSGTG
jgi:hypothetical protein